MSGSRIATMKSMTKYSHASQATAAVTPNTTEINTTELDDRSATSLANVIEKMRAAQAEWRGLPLSKRAYIIDRVGRLIVSKHDELVQSVHRPASNPAEIMASEVWPLLEACRYVGLYARSILKSGPRESLGKGAFWMGSITVREERIPWGIVLIVGPSNYPLLLPGTQLIQALVAGNACLVKPAPHCRKTMQCLADICVEAGVHKHLVHVLESAKANFDKAVDLGVDKVVFTGSFSTGQKIAAKLAEKMIPATMELSGCDAVFVLDDADLSRVASTTQYALTINGSQSCIAPRRLFATRPIIEQLLPKLDDELSERYVTPPSKEALETAIKAIRSALDAGAKIAIGSLDDWLSARPSPNELIEPIVLTGVTADMAIARSDLFAPVMSIIEVADIEDALTKNRQCPYALGASVFGSTKTATDVARRLDVGCITINDILVPTADARVSFGGRGQSGYGMTRGPEGLREMTRLQVTCVRSGKWMPHLTTPEHFLDQALRGMMLLTRGNSLAQRWSGLKMLMNRNRIE